MVSPEFFPYAKVGGLGDVVGALPKILAKQNIDVRICLPLYGGIEKKPSWKFFENIPVYLGNQTKICRVWEALQDECIIYFIEYNQYFERNGIYSGQLGPHFDNGERFAFFSKASIDVCKALKWIPDVIHCHDWTTGLIPVYLNTTEALGALKNTATVFTIHNLQHQGFFDKNILNYAGIPFSEYKQDGLEALGCVNFMKGAIYHSTKITTVSETYAKEIQTTEFGCGLENVLKFKAADLIGITNGIDTDVWNPETDPLIPQNFSLKDLSGKKICKKTLQAKFDLPQDEKIPVLGVVSRLYDQKGLDVFFDIIPNLLATNNLQIIIVGAGEPFLEQKINELSSKYPQNVASYIGYKNDIAHLVEAGADMFVMPSRFEPCGLNQMYSMRYGTLPIVRNTGGLADTVIDAFNNDEKIACGFVFNELNHNNLINIILQANNLFLNNYQKFQNLQINAMSKDFTWNKSANLYQDVYSWAITTKQKNRAN